MQILGAERLQEARAESGQGGGTVLAVHLHPRPVLLGQVLLEGAIGLRLAPNLSGIFPIGCVPENGLGSVAGLLGGQQLGVAERDPPVPPPKAKIAVSPSSKEISSGSRPSFSHMICL